MEVELGGCGWLQVWGGVGGAVVQGTGLGRGGVKVLLCQVVVVDYTTT